MIKLIAYLILIAVSARGIQQIWEPRDEENRAFGEDLLVLTSLGMILWSAEVWFLAALQILNADHLLEAGLFVTAVLVLWGWVKGRPIDTWRLPRPRLPDGGFERATWVLFGLLVTFALWRGWLLPTLNTDALYLSLPKADQYVADRGMNLFIPPAQAWMSHAAEPSTYEMLLASVMSLVGNDHLTEWVATCSGALYAVMCFVLFRQWFKARLTAYLGWVLVLSVTVFLLHLSSDKADLTTNLACLMLITWTARSLGRPTTWNLGMAVLSGFLLLGLKKSGWLVFPIFMLILLVRMIRRPAIGLPRPRYGLLILLALVGLLLLGGLNHLYLWAQTGNPFGVYQAGDQLASSAFTLGDPLRFLAIVALAPYIVSSPRTLHLPWNGQDWYWPPYNLFFSHFGYAFIIVLVLSLWAGLRGLRRGSDPRVSPAAKPWIWLALLATAIIASHRRSYDGEFATTARFVLFLVPALLAGGVLPLLDHWSMPLSKPALRRTLLASTLALASFSALQAYRLDAHAPWPYVADLWAHPDARRMIFINPNRVTSMVDRMAGPGDVIASDLTFQTWLHPLWGEELTRKVQLISWEGGRAHIPAEAQWAVADNLWNQVRGNGQQRIRTAADLAKVQGWGLPTPRDTALYRQLRQDPHWRLILSNEFGNQCAFQRVYPAGTPASH